MNIFALNLKPDAVTHTLRLLHTSLHPSLHLEDIVLGDLLNNKHVSFWWIDWQQGGNAGGMTSYKHNPTIWLAHLRCTDRHRSVSFYVKISPTAV